jgi:hypothetical protein
MWLILQQPTAEDFVILTGEQYSVRDFVNAAAHELGIAMRWEASGVDEKGDDGSGRCIVAVDPRYFRPTEVETLLGDASMPFVVCVVRQTPVRATPPLACWLASDMWPVVRDHARIMAEGDWP